jgi:hypothetical protein
MVNIACLAIPEGVYSHITIWNKYINSKLKAWHESCSDILSLVFYRENRFKLKSFSQPSSAK